MDGIFIGVIRLLFEVSVDGFMRDRGGADGKRVYVDSVINNGDDCVSFKVRATLLLVSRVKFLISFVQPSKLGVFICCQWLMHVIKTPPTPSSRTSTAPALSACLSLIPHA